MFFGVLDDGSCEIKGTEDELLEFIATVREAIEDGEAEGAMLNKEFVIPLRVSCEDT